MFALSIKYKSDLRFDMKIENNSFTYLGYKLIDLDKDKNIIVWRIFEIKNNIIHIEGKENLWIPRNEYFYYCKFRGKIFYPKYILYQNYDFVTMYGIIQKGRIIIFDIPVEFLDAPQVIFFYISYLNFHYEIFTSLGLYSKIPSGFNGYYRYNNIIFKYIENRITLFPYSENLEEQFENLYRIELKKIKKYNIIKLRNKTIEYRKKNNNKDHIWIITDRRDKAGDNGEYFFRYLKSKKLYKIKVYFAIEKNCSDFKNLNVLGDIIDLNSEIYIDKFIKADKIISSISNTWVTNPFENDYKYIRDLLHFESIFLQHGIIKDDLSKILNRYNKNYDYFITSSKKEYYSVLDPKYLYNKNSVILTGLPRYDVLQKLKITTEKERKIIIIPTWRMYIKGTLDIISYKSIHSDTFKFTDYFKFYNDLINDKYLLEIMKNFNYSGIFCLHPCFSSQWIDFNQNEIFYVWNQCNYQELLLKGSLLITDYSSIFFDFAYLKKPIIYSHFDYIEYRKYHYQKGYFDYKKDGFGKVCDNIKCTVDEIVYEIQNNCFLKNKYLRRINKFFTFSDENNSKRIFDKILNKKSKRPNYYLFYFLYFSILFIIICKININKIFNNKIKF